MQKVTTTDLAEFGARERRIAENLLEAWRVQGLPEGFVDDEVTIMMNKNSGFVFLTNSDFQVAMLNVGKLEIFYSCPECGHEGFKEEMAHNLDGKNGCRDYLRSIGAIRTQRQKAIHS